MEATKTPTACDRHRDTIPFMDCPECRKAASEVAELQAKR